jgi:hypothetical protein
MKIHVPGVFWCATRKKWAARFMHEGRMYHVGRFDTQYRAMRQLKAFKRKVGVK